MDAQSPKEPREQVVLAGAIVFEPRILLKLARPLADRFLLGVVLLLRQELLSCA